MIPAPFLLYLGHSTDFVGIKTSRGLAEFRRDDCVGEFRHDDSPLTLGLPRMTIEEGAAAGAKTLVLGIANSGGVLGGDLVADAKAALDFAQFATQIGTHARVQCRERFIEQQQGGVHGQRPRDGHALLLSAGQLIGPGIELVAQPHPFQHDLRQRAGLRFRRLARDHGRQHDIAARAQVREQIELLEDHADFQAQRAQVQVVVHQLRVAHHDGALVYGFQAVDAA